MVIHFAEEPSGDYRKCFLYIYLYFKYFTHKKADLMTSASKRGKNGHEKILPRAASRGPPYPIQSRTPKSVRPYPFNFTQDATPPSGCLCWGWESYLCQDAELVQGTLGGHGGRTGKAGGGRGVGCRGRRGGMVALLDQVW